MKTAEKPKFRSISSKIFFRIFIVYFFIASILTAFQMIDVYLRHKTSFMTKLDTYGRSIEDGLGLAIWDFNENELVSIAEGVLKIPMVKGVKIKELRHGTILFQKGVVSVEQGSGEPNEIQNKSGVFAFLENEIIESLRTVHYKKENQAVAVVTLYSNQAIMLSGVKYSLFIILGSAVLKTFALWCLFTLILAKYLIRPLDELLSLVENIDGRSIKLPTQRQQKDLDELSLFQSAFNAMLTRLHKSNEDLEGTNQQLNAEMTEKYRAMEEIHILNEKLESRILERTETLEETKGFLTQLIESFPNPVFYKQCNGAYNMVNGAFKSKFGVTNSGIESDIKLMDTDFLQESSAALEKLSDDKVTDRESSYSYETSLIDTQGNKHELLITKAPVIDQATKCIGIVGMMVDISERKKLESKLVTYATIDALTGCYNRRYFLEQAQKEVSRGQRHGYEQAVLYLDIDHFKEVNDQYGHQVGDRVLVQFSETCRALFREGDIVGRVGGEEFAVILPHTSLDMACQVAERLRLKIEAMEVKAREVIKVSVSIGVSPISNSMSLDESIRRADLALYSAKSAGRNCIQCYHGGLKDTPD